MYSLSFLGTFALLEALLNLSPFLQFSTAHFVPYSIEYTMVNSVHGDSNPKLSQADSNHKPQPKAYRYANCTQLLGETWLYTNPGGECPTVLYPDPYPT